MGANRVRTTKVRQFNSVKPSCPIWDDPAWNSADLIEIDQFHKRSSSHRPVTTAKIAYDSEAIHLRFSVEDQYVRCVCEEYLGPVCKDSCVEFFVRPDENLGYFNIEVNCGGGLHVSYIRDWTMQPGGFADWTPLPPRHGSQIEILPSHPGRIEPEVETPLRWQIGLRIPFAVFEQYINADIRPRPGRQWRANFYKCGDETSHPHWAAWSPIKRLSFHQPDCFGVLSFS